MLQSLVHCSACAPSSATTHACAAATVVANVAYAHACGPQRQSLKLVYVRTYDDEYGVYLWWAVPAADLLCPSFVVSSRGRTVRAFSVMKAAVAAVVGDTDTERPVALHCMRVLLRPPCVVIIARGVSYG
jgi:hypothetical protein